METIDLRLKPYKQIDSYKCGPICLKLVYEYYGIKKSLKELVEETKTNVVHGSIEPALGYSLLRNSFDVRWYSFYRDLVKEEYGNLSQKELLRIFRIKYKLTKDVNDKSLFRDTIEYLEEEGKLFKSVIKLKDLITELENRRPVLVSLDLHVLDDAASGHWAVICGFDGQNLLVHDLKGEIAKYDPEEFFAAAYKDDGDFLLFKPKERGVIKAKDLIRRRIAHLLIESQRRSTCSKNKLGH